MKTLVLDTNIVSYVMKGHSLAGVYTPLIAGHRLAVSFMTVAELHDGAIWANWGRVRIDHLERTLTQYLVIGSSPSICRLWGQVRYSRRAQPISSEDAWIAATALAHDCELVTHNPSDFGGIPQLRLLTAAPHP